MEYAYINSEVLRWAKERCGLSAESLAIELGVPQPQVNNWENGIEYPPFGRAQSLANALKIPFGYLFLSKPPTNTPPLPDLRTVDGTCRPPSPSFCDLLNDVLVKHDWYLDNRKNAGAKPLPFVGKFSISTPMSNVVADIRAAINPEGLRHDAPSWSEYLRLLVQQAEHLEIVVMRGGVVRGNPNRALSVAEFRGFAISDRLAPLIFINAKDAQAAQIFTLAHELVHIWIGQSGISNPNPVTPTDLAGLATVEEFCNRAAAELLVPSKEFVSLWEKSTSDLENRASALAKRFKVSVPVILRRALEYHEINRTTFLSLFRVHQEKVEEAQSKQNDDEGLRTNGGNFYNTFFARNSRILSRAITSAVRSGELSKFEAARFLSVRTSTISKLAERIIS